MAYAPFRSPWRDGESGGTPITAEALNYIEAGIAAIDSAALTSAAAAATYLPRSEAESLQTDSATIALTAQVFS